MGKLKYRKFIYLSMFFVFRLLISSRVEYERDRRSEKYYYLCIVFLPLYKRIIRLCKSTYRFSVCVGRSTQTAKPDLCLLLKCLIHIFIGRCCLLLSGIHILLSSATHLCKCLYQVMNFSSDRNWIRNERVLLEVASRGKRPRTKTTHMPSLRW